jgi:hypothetical protein
MAKLNYEKLKREPIAQADYSYTKVPCRNIKSKQKEAMEDRIALAKLRKELY